MKTQFVITKYGSQFGKEFVSRVPVSAIDWIKKRRGEKCFKCSERLKHRKKEMCMLDMKHKQKTRSTSHT